MEKRIKSDGEKIADIIRDSGGRIVGRTKLQKIAYLLELAGVGAGFHFDYYHYGPYSEELSMAASIANALKLIKEKETQASWGGFYSTYTVANSDSAYAPQTMRQKLASFAVEENSTILELAATAAYFAYNGESEPWEETARRKPDKADGGRLEDAKNFYRKLCTIGEQLPKIL